jgi:hypothetical protein
MAPRKAASSVAIKRNQEMPLKAEMPNIVPGTGYL